MENLDLKTMLEEMKAQLERTYTGMDTNKATANALLQGASMIVAFIGLLTGNNQLQKLHILNIPSEAVLVMYAVLVVLCVAVIRPIKMYGPVKPNWITLDDAFTGKSEKDILEKQLSGYLNVIGKNEEIVKRYSVMVTVASILLGMIVISLVF
jgi:hypothetical protein